MPKTLFITGASRGVGLKLVETAVADGWVALATVRAPSERLAALAGLTGKIDVLELDVSDEASLERLATRLDARKIDLAVANAGVYEDRARSVEDPLYDAALWRETLMTNVFGVFAAARAALPGLRRAPEPKLAVIASAMGSTARAPGGSYAYRASKAAAVNLARNLATDWRADGVAVGAYHPGWVRTEMGGPDAEISVEESASGLWRRFQALSLATTGVFETYDGQPIAY